jgi:hypothetical protein
MDNSSKVKLSTNASEIFENALKLAAKHKAEGEASPLHALTGINWKEFEDGIPKASNIQKEAEEYRAKSDAKYRERDNYLEPIVEVLRVSKNLLKAINEKNPKVLAEWGYNVSYTTSKKSNKKSTTSKKKGEE